MHACRVSLLSVLRDRAIQKLAQYLWERGLPAMNDDAIHLTY
jgi:hypothetical protein